jgi:Na+/H+ antiporter NhaD/arsenite permease-like protein
MVQLDEAHKALMCSCHRGVELEGATFLSAIVIIFIIAYVAIALEHPIMINKGASALLGAGLLWTVYAVFGGDHALIGNQLNESVATTAQIVFFLIGAMTIVEVIDAHNGFEIITSQIRTRKQTTLMCIVCFVTFFLSAVLDNLTTTIVMISLMKKLSDSQGDRLFFAAMIVIAANAGGAWSVIGDVTTTMLWIGGQITPLPIIKGVFLPSLINLLLPMLVVAYLLKGKEIAPHASHPQTSPELANQLSWPAMNPRPKHPPGLADDARQHARAGRAKLGRVLPQRCLPPYGVVRRVELSG